MMASNVLSGKDLVPLLWGMPRGKRPEADLRRRYRRDMQLSLVLATLLVGLIFALFPHIEFEYPAALRQPVIVWEEDNIPETVQVVRQPEIERPVEPVVKETQIPPPEELNAASVEVQTDLADLALLAPPEPAAAAPSRAGSGKIDESEKTEIGEAFKSPRPRIRLAATYPREAYSRFEGTIFINALVGADGRVEAVQAQPARASLAAFYKAAEKAVQYWKFTPAQSKEGRPTKAWVSVPFTFHKPGSGGAGAISVMNGSGGRRGSGMGQCSSPVRIDGSFRR